MDDNLHLKLTEFEIHMFYGFLIQPPTDEQFDKMKHSNNCLKPCHRNGTTHMRPGWCVTYQINSGQSETTQFKYQFAHYPLNLNNVEIIESDDGMKKWPSANSPLTADIETHVSLRRDGAGTLTLSFKFKSDESKPLYNVADILLASNLVPRSIRNDSECSQVTNLQLPVPDGLSEVARETWHELSFPFRLFVLAVRDLSKQYKLSWNEIKFTGSGKAVAGKKKPQDYLYGELSCGNDPQIPYQYVFAGMESEKYRLSFLEDNEPVVLKRKSRERYSKEIAAILGRWFNENNIKYTSTDYWEQRGLMKDGCFYSQYMNSLIFTTYSGLLTLSFYPSIDQDFEKEKVYFERVKDNTFQTIMRCLEFSRMRWHNAIWLNKEFEHLIKIIVEKKVTTDFAPVLDYLIKLEERVALHLEDPLSFLWDASVGSHISKFLQTSLIERIETEISNKLNHSRNLLNDKLKKISTSEITNFLTR